MNLSNSVLTLYGLLLAPTLNLFKLRFLVLGSSTAHLRPKFALKCSFKLRFSPEIGLVLGTNPVCPWDRPGVVGGRKKILKFMC